MKLRFKGEDPKRRIKTGEVYDVEIRTVKDYIVIIIDSPELGRIYFPYKTIGTITHYWKSA